MGVPTLVLELHGFKHAMNRIYNELYKDCEINQVNFIQEIANSSKSSVGTLRSQISVGVI